MGKRLALLGGHTHYYWWTSQAASQRWGDGDFWEQHYALICWHPICYCLDLERHPKTGVLKAWSNLWYYQEVVEASVGEVYFKEVRLLETCP